MHSARTLGSSLWRRREPSHLGLSYLWVLQQVFLVSLWNPDFQLLVFVILPQGFLQLPTLGTSIWKYQGDTPGGPKIYRLSSSICG